MNQILQVEKNNNSKGTNTKKIVLFFAVGIILFGLILCAQGAYSVYQKKANEKVTPQPINNNNNNTVVEVPEPTINFIRTEDDKLILNIESQIAISHIIYNWNQESATTLEETGKTNIEEIIDMPSGTNTINISVIDLNGRETKKQEIYEVETSKPIIDLAVVGNDIKINVTSETDLSYVTYKWNQEIEKKEDMQTYITKKKFEKSIEIPKGQNTLKIVAVDVKNNSSEKSQEIKGVTKSKTETVAKGEYLEFTVTGEDNIKIVEIEFNGKKGLMNETTFGQTKVVHYKLNLVEGKNYLKVISTTETGAVDTSLWVYEYKKAQ